MNSISSVRKQLVENTYAEAFRSIYARILITARDSEWLQHVINAVTGHSSSTIMCDCESGVEQVLEAENTPDGRPGAVIQFHVPRFRKDRVEALERVLLSRVSQNVLTCPTARCFNLLESDTYFRLGRKIAYFGDGFESLTSQFGRKMWNIPIMGGAFQLDRRFGYADGIMGGNLWFMSKTQESAIDAAKKAANAVDAYPDVITTFPGGVAASASKAGSKYSFLFASTYETYCPTLRESLGEESGVPEGVKSIMEIIINGSCLDQVAEATHRAIDAAIGTDGLVRITAGNYDGRLGKSFIYLRPDLQTEHAAV